MAQFISTSIIRSYYDPINTRNFSILRRIKQLGTSSTYHGTHCLGVAEMLVLYRDFEISWRMGSCWVSLDHDRCTPSWPWTWGLLIYFGASLIRIAIALQEIIGESWDRDSTRSALQVAPDLKVADTIDHTYPNKQVVQLISSRIDTRAAWTITAPIFTGAS